jgi:putative colanic acid biosynthesis acetyltransferase WcaF
MSCVNDNAGIDAELTDHLIGTQSESQVRNDLFNNRVGFDLGKPKGVFILWYLIKQVFFLSSVPWPSSLKRVILRLFGARVGGGITLKPRVNIHIPWKLSIGDHAWIGEEVCILNFENVEIGAQCCLSQRSFLCSGNHDYRSTDMRYRNAPITLESGVWIGAGAFVGPGARIGPDAVITALSLVTRSLDGGWIYSGNPCEPVRKRWTKDHEVRCRS